MQADVADQIDDLVTPVQMESLGKQAEYRQPAGQGKSDQDAGLDERIFGQKKSRG